MAVVGAVICGVAALVAAIAAAILGSPQVAVTAAGAALVTAQALVIGWGTTALLNWIFLQRKHGGCF